MAFVFLFYLFCVLPNFSCSTELSEGMFSWALDGFLPDTVFGLALACFPYSYVCVGVFELIIIKLGSSLQIFCCDIMSICEFFLFFFF